MKKVVALENDLTLNRADYVNAFIKQYDGEVIVLTNFANRGKSEIIQAVSQCTDIAVQTCFIGGSDYQLDGMVALLSKMPQSINVYIAYLGIDNNNELREYLVNNLTPEELFSVKHHNIYAMSRDRYGEISEREPDELLNFDSVIAKIYKAHAKKAIHNLFIENYKETARTRPTGRKVLVLGCTALGHAFKNLPIGKEVDELVCDKLLQKQSKARGVWIWGNGEPIMLVNDHGFREYKITTKLDSHGILLEIGKTINYYKNINKLKPLTIRGLIHIIEATELNEERDGCNYSPLGKANLICELLKIPKRGNRQIINNILSENLLETV